MKKDNKKRDMIIFFVIDYLIVLITLVSLVLLTILTLKNKLGPSRIQLMIVLISFNVIVLGILILSNIRSIKKQIICKSSKIEIITLIVLILSLHTIDRAWKGLGGGWDITGSGIFSAICFWISMILVPIIFIKIIYTYFSELIQSQKKDIIHIPSKK